MYNRTRTHNNLNLDSAGIAEVRDTHNDIVNETFCPLQDPSLLTISRLVEYPTQYDVGTISDLVVKPLPRNKRRISPPVFKPAKPVHHLRKKLIPSSDEIAFSFKSPGIGLCNTSLTTTITSNPIAYLCDRYGVDYFRDHYLDLIPLSHDGHTFASPDWYSLQSEFYELFDQLTPSSFFGGESAAESGIFIDAFRFLVSPSKALLGIFKNVKRRGLRFGTTSEALRHFRNFTFSQPRMSKTYRAFELANDIGYTKAFVKDAVDLHLLYKFGIRPAFSDIESTVVAHSKVANRLAYLRNNAGNHVPIRVRRRSNYSRFDYGSGPGFLSFENRIVEEYSLATISALARVRTDINEVSRWRAYAEYFGLNKIIGTAWELIPFTFVVDWFTNAQERINDLTRIRLGDGPFMSLAAVSHSVKNVLSWETVCFPGWDSTTGTTLLKPNSPFPMLRVEVSDYTRNIGFPDTSGVFDISSLGLFHGTTFGELLYQKFT